MGGGRRDQRGRGEGLEVAERDARVGVVRGDHLPLFRELQPAVDGAAGETEDRAIRGATAADAATSRRTEAMSSRPAVNETMYRPAAAGPNRAWAAAMAVKVSNTSVAATPGTTSRPGSPSSRAPSTARWTALC